MIFLVILAISQSLLPALAGNYSSLGGCQPNVPKAINIHLVPHSHLDVGWKETVDSYYNQGSVIRVKAIFDSVFRALMTDEKRRFVTSEMAFFERWWNEQNVQVRQKVRQMVHEGRLQFAGGGWTQNDEATTHYTAIIDNLSLGWKFISDTFGEDYLPKVGWQLDPFGHSLTQGLISCEIGLEGMFFQRIDFKEKAERYSSGTNIFSWEVGPQKALLTSLVEYTSPQMLNLDALWGNPGFQEEDVVEYIMNEPNVKHGLGQVMIPMGGDFQYIEAETNFQRMDQLIADFNSKFAQYNFHLFYSTPFCFLQQLKQLKRQWPTRKGDFMPYISEGNKVWTGYYTSRPAIKYAARVANSILQAVKQMIVTAAVRGGKSDLQPKVLQRSVAILQHHDAITGTEKEHVAQDYLQQLRVGLLEAQDKLSQHLLGAPSSLQFADLDHGHKWPLLKPGKTVFLVYNRQSKRMSDRLVLLMDKWHQVSITHKKETIPVDILPFKGGFQIHFKAENVPPLGYKKFTIELRSSQDMSNMEVEPSVPITEEQISQLLGLSISMGCFESSRDRSNPSGAYIFSPREARGQQKGPNHKKITSAFLSENKGFSQVSIHYENGWNVTVGKYMDDIIVDWEVGVLDVPVDSYGIDAYITYKAVDFHECQNRTENVTFVTDSNGWHMVGREYKSGNLLAANFYPVTSSIFVQDCQREMSILVDRSQAGTSANHGEVILLIHRRLKLDDGMGLDEPLDDQSAISGTHKIAISKSHPEAHKWRKAQAQPMLIWVLKNEEDNVEEEFCGIAEGILPENVSVLSLETWAEKEVLLRLENQSDEAVSAELPDLLTLIPKLNAQKCQVRNLVGGHQQQQHLISCSNTALNALEIKTFLLSW